MLIHINIQWRWEKNFFTFKCTLSAENLKVMIKLTFQQVHQYHIFGRFLAVEVLCIVSLTYHQLQSSHKSTCKARSETDTTIQFISFSKDLSSSWHVIKGLYCYKVALVYLFSQKKSVAKLWVKILFQTPTIKFYYRLILL